MAHIPDGVLSLPVLITGAVVTAATVAVATRRMDYDRIPQAAVLAAAFFVASLVTVPVGPSSVHLILNGLMGVLLGWAAVPAVLIALLMQAMFFGYGGLMVLGVNTANIALPALLCGALIAPRLHASEGRATLMWGALAGGLAVALTAVMVSLSLLLSGPEYLPAGKVVALTYLPLMVAEAAVTAAALSFMQRVAPELLLAGRV
ncbi:MULTISPECIES: cobalt transporter CbiM [Ferrimonas]|uniref:cobalt transporter CbiM n=1 Tax=Ferrimonas TaxID=44011 RepID=UPI0003FB72D0|nr:MULTISPECIES: cobalt transporter CbiM [Ferrimonas]USD38024.1 cobalt transporter CbiM [Ferrimonas sp. SCSIO 43195]